MQRFLRLPGETLAILAAVIFAWSNVVMRQAVHEMPALQVVWVRFTIAAILLVFAGWWGWITLRTDRPYLLLARGVFAALGVMCSFHAVALTSFSNYSVLVYTNPLIGTMLSIWWFKERFRLKHAAILLVTFAGILLVLQPQWRAIHLGDILALLAGGCFGMALALVKEATKTEGVWMLTASFYVIVALLSGPTVLSSGLAFTQKGWVYILTFMVLGTGAQLLETRAYRSISVPVGGTLSYITAVVSIALGVWLFHEPLTLAFLMGAALIIGCGVYLIWDSSHSAAEAKEAT